MMALAERSSVWDFTTADVPQLINNGLTTVERTNEGLHIRTDEDGFIGWQNDQIPRADVVTIEAKSALKTEAAFMWQPVNGSQGDLYKLFVTTSGKNEFEDLKVSLSDYHEWDPRTPLVAIAFPAGTDIVIRSMTWQSWSNAEKLNEAVKSFFTFDTNKQHSINFLWGPLLTFDPVTRSTMFDTLPPAGISAMRAVYCILLLFVMSGGALLVRGKKRRGVAVMVGSIACAWLLLDLRMGAELLSYAATDIRSYVLAETHEKTFRTLGSEPVVIDATTTALQDSNASRLVLMEPKGHALRSNVRLRAYPLDVVTDEEGIAPAARSAWLILKMPGVTVTDGYVRAADGHALSAKGSVIRRFGDDSFLFLEQ